MSKPYWKTFFSKINKKFFKKKDLYNINIWKKNDIITKTLIGKNIQIYNGKEFKIFNITEERVGYRFGEFIPTRKPYIYKGKKKILKKIK